MATTFTDTLFSTKYKDDYADSDGYYRILFNSGRSLQARELTQMQTIIQKQIERFGNNIFKEKGGKEAERFVYIDNTVQGTFLGPENKGLVPGMLENVAEMNPLDIMTAFSQEAVPPCREITRSTMPNKGRKTHHVAFTDLPEKYWKEGFQTVIKELKNMKNSNNEIEIPEDLLIKYPLLNILTSSVSVVLLVLLIYLMKRQ